MASYFPKLVFCIVICGTIHAHAGEFLSDFGKVVVPKADLPLRATPPGLFQSKGNIVGTARQDESFRLLEQRTVPTITGSENWIKVQTTDNPTKEGWIYTGPIDNPSANVTPSGR